MDAEKLTQWVTAGIGLLLPYLAGGCLTTQATGCAMIEPQTAFSVSPFGTVRFFDSKDNDIIVKGLQFDPDSNGFSLAEMTVTNKSSPVIDANVQQMMAFVAQQQAANEGITAAFDGLSKTVEALSGTVEALLQNLPAVSGEVDTPIGKGEIEVTPQGKKEPDAPEPNARSTVIPGGAQG
jgi:hypothetical protein